MGRLGPDDRPGFKNIGVLEGYNRWARTYERDPNPLIALEEPVTLQLIGPVKDQRVLDLGCGTGRYCVLLAERGASVVGLDPAVEMIELARRKASAHCAFELLCGTLETAGFPDEHFDLVLSALTLGHLAELRPTLQEAARILKTGGRLVISDLHPCWPVSGHDYVEFFDEAGQEYRIPQHPHLIGDYWRLLRALGLQVGEIRELRIDRPLIGQFPSLEGYEGIPLAMILRADKGPSAGGGLSAGI